MVLPCNRHSAIAHCAASLTSIYNIIHQRFSEIHVSSREVPFTFN